MNGSTGNDLKAGAAASVSGGGPTGYGGGSPWALSNGGAGGMGGFGPLGIGSAYYGGGAQTGGALGQAMGSAAGMSPRDQFEFGQSHPGQAMPGGVGGPNGSNMFDASSVWNGSYSPKTDAGKYLTIGGYNALQDKAIGDRSMAQQYGWFS